LEELQIQYEKEVNEVRMLEEDLLDPTNPRYRELPAKAGDGPSGEDVEILKMKEQELQQRLYVQQEKVLEKDLILNEVTELSERLQKQAASGRDYTLNMAKKVNTFQSTIKSTSKKMMATLSELSVVQANTLRLERDVSSVKEELSVAKENLAAGEEILPGADAEWEKIERNLQRRAENLQSLKSRREGQVAANQIAATLTRTTAEPRPNAYIPYGSELAIPKPYGGHAPLKPALETQAAKFYRKPVPKPIDFDA